MELPEKYDIGFRSRFQDILVVCILPLVIEHPVGGLVSGCCSEADKCDDGK
jgi:hypothetical protein